MQAQRAGTPVPMMEPLAWARAWAPQSSPHGEQSVEVLAALNEELLLKTMHSAFWK
jgi:hypothetical protein